MPIANGSSAPRHQQKIRFIMTDEQAERYYRQILLKEIGAEGQRRLMAARVLVVGAGGLGSPAALYLAAAGVGRLGIADFDAVDRSNLQRQILHSTQDVGKAKVESAVARIADVNPNVTVAAISAIVHAGNVQELTRKIDYWFEHRADLPKVGEEYIALAKTLSIASKLVKKGNLDVASVVEYVMDKDLAYFKHSTKIRSKLKVKGHFGYIVLSKEQLDKIGVTNMEAKINIDEIGKIKEFNIWSIATENEGLYDVSVRSRRGYTINEICAHYGGGGHKNAGTCQLDNDKVDAELPIILDKINGKIPVK